MSPALRRYRLAPLALLLIVAWIFPASCGHYERKYNGDEIDIPEGTAAGNVAAGKSCASNGSG